ncbi:MULTISPECIES: hypothetical protein [unclassified Streptomyces]|nr:hypothetical protein [Streptomyces sp. DH41]MDG9727620.1 hypothetical protein [Streptomyces sp. DH41]
MNSMGKESRHLGIHIDRTATDADFERGAGTVAADLARLKELMESG